MKCCLLLPSRINFSIQMYQQFILACCFSLCCCIVIIVKWDSDYFMVFTRAMQKGLCYIVSVQLAYTVSCMWGVEQQWGSETYCLLSHFALLFEMGEIFKHALTPLTSWNFNRKVRVKVKLLSAQRLLINSGNTNEQTCWDTLSVFHKTLLSIACYLSLYKPLLLACACCGLLCRFMRSWTLQSLSVWWGMFQYPAHLQQSAW